MKSKLKEIEVQTSFYIDEDTFEGDLKEVIDRIKAIPEKFKLLEKDMARPTKYHRFKIATYHELGDDFTRFKLYGLRYETEEERCAREDKNRQQKKANAERAIREDAEKKAREFSEFKRLEKLYKNKKP